MNRIIAFVTTAGIVASVLSGCSDPAMHPKPEQPSCAHKWGRWSEPETESNWLGTWIRQFRTCAECGEAQSRLVTGRDNP